MLLYTNYLANKKYLKPYRKIKDVLQTESQYGKNYINTLCTLEIDSESL